MKSRSLSIRARILVLLLAPLLPLLGIWFSSTNESFGSALDLLDSRTTADDAGVPANVVLTEIQAERKLSVVHLGQTVPLLVAQRQKTDEAIAYFQRVSSSDRLRDAATPLTMQHLGRLNESLDRINLMRAGIDEGRFTRVQTLNNYNEIIDRAYAMYSSIGGVNDQELARNASTIIALTEARDMLKREDTLISGMLAAGTTTIPEIVEMVQAIGLNRYLLANATRNLPAQDQAAYQELISGVPYQNLRSMEERLIAQTRDQLPLPIDGLWWQATFEEVDRQLFELGDAATQRTIAAATTTAVGVLLRLAIAGGLGLIVIVVLIIISIRIARSLIRRITALRLRALDLANESLPRAVARLRQGEKVEVPEMPMPEADELGQLSNAFEAVHRTAIESAVQEAALRTGLNQVFLNIGRRSQTLVHRQLSLLETMERRVTDPGELEEIYRVDHLAVRMRRYAEDLVILAGAVPGRGWRYPVPLSDVLRSAMSEVEDYTRVTVVSVPDLALAGRAVSDVIHLIAELLENATTFSPKDTQVKLIGQMLPNGFAVEIEDRGVGMPAPDLAEANERLANPPDFDPARSSRLGLFVVARLAARHGVKVSLQPSIYGGITAVALLPNEIVVKKSQEIPALTASPGDSVIDAESVLEDTEAMMVISAFPAAPPRRERPIAASAEGLPVRARQANLVPQLREAPVEVEVEARPTRPAEHTRSLLSALQAGVSRGRQEAANQDEEEGR
jgi:signal transduction histidine kinase